MIHQPNGLAKAVRDAALAENSATVKFTFAKVRGTYFIKPFTLRTCSIGTFLSQGQILLQV